MKRLLLLGALAAVGLVACGDDDDVTPATTTTAATAPAPSAPATTAPTTTAAAPTTTAAATTTAPAAATWERIAPGGDCQCALGGEYGYWVHRGDPTKVMLFFQGGGACFSAATCDPSSGAYKTTTGPEDDPSLRPAGLLDLANPANPVAGWSIVYVPYCTGDVFLGDKTTQYSDTVTVHHVGAVDTGAALAGLAQMFPATTQLLVAGESAGGVPTPLAAGEAHDLLPNATIEVLADSSGAYPDVPAVNALVGQLWGTLEALPAWPETSGLTQEQLSIPGLFVLAGKHAPAIRFTRHDYAFDETQAFFGSLAGFDATNLVQLIDQNEQEIEAAGVDLASYVAPGSSHTVIGKADFYTETVNGVPFLQWVTDLVNGTPVTDVHCVQCQGP
jgi:Pectinacetylesterase